MKPGRSQPVVDRVPAPGDRRCDLDLSSSQVPTAGQRDQSNHTRINPCSNEIAMKAIYLSARAPAPSLRYGDIPQPTVRDDDILVKVHAAAIMPAELDFPSTFQTAAGGPRPFPIVLGHQFSGVVAAMGAQSADLRIGDAVYGINDWHGNGAQAEYCIARADSLARKPRLIDHVQASVLPMPALAAWDGLFAVSQLQRGQHVLIHGTASGVGFIAVQLARWRGARITATASSCNLTLVRLLGADRIIDERMACFDEALKTVDLALDCIGCDNLARSCGDLEASGRLVRISDPCALAGDLRGGGSPMRGRAAGSLLAQIGSLIDAGDIRVFVDAVYPLSRPKRAYARPARDRRIGDSAVRIVDPA
jgi:NADPH:quinone reductase-like Zn-dependent oxidoreductase